MGGGGGVIRTAARAAIGGSYGSVPLAIGCLKPSPATVSSPPLPSGEARCPSISWNPENAHLEPTVAQQPSPDIDNWVFADRPEESEKLFDSPPPRIVFGPPPTLEEAQEATSDLKNAIDKIYFSPTSTECELPKKVGPTLPNSTNSSEALSCTSVGSATVAPASNSVIQAFSLLKQSTEVQNVVASLASDKTVWDAVMKNEKVMEFYKSHQTSFQVGDSEDNKDADETARSGLDCCTERSSNDSTKSSSGIVQFIDAMKHGVSKMMMDLNAAKVRVLNLVMDLPTLVQDFLVNSLGNLGASMSQPNDKSTNSIVGGTFVGLAIAAIMVVLLKRA